MLVFDNYDIAVLFLRLGIGFLYVYAAYRNSCNKVNMQWTIENTKPLFVHTKFETNLSLIRTCAYMGVFIMYAGGISVLVGIEGRLGALMLVLFTIGGTVIHRRQQIAMHAIALEDGNNPQVAAPAWSAFAAHFANILKNISLILIMILLMLCGTGKYQISDTLKNLFNSN